MFRLGLAQCSHPADGDVLAMVDSYMARAKDASVDLLVFPESLRVPFDTSADEIARLAEPVGGPFCTAVNALAAKYGLWTVYTAVVAGEVGGRPYNTAVIVDSDGAMQALYRKVHLFDTDFIRESDKYSAGSELLAPVETPFGRIGVGICYDLRFPELARAAALGGADLMVYPSAWVDGPGKVDQWRTLLASRAIENEMFVAGLSRCDRGSENAVENPTATAAIHDYAGHSCVFGPLGEELASAGVDEQLLVADIDLGEIAKARAVMPVLTHVRPDVY